MYRNWPHSKIEIYIPVMLLHSPITVMLLHSPSVLADRPVWLVLYSQSNLFDIRVENLQGLLCLLVTIRVVNLRHGADSGPVAGSDQIVRPCIAATAGFFYLMAL